MAADGEASGVDEAFVAVDAITARLRNLGPVMQVAAEDTRKLIDDSFQSQSSPAGVPWAPHSPTTTAIRAKRGRSGNILIDTARLRQSITSQQSGNGFRFGTNVGYAGPQQTGAAIKVFGRKAAQLVARPFLPVTGTGNGQFALMTDGPAGSHWARVRDMIAKYVSTGEI